MLGRGTAPGRPDGSDTRRVQAADRRPNRRPATDGPRGASKSPLRVGGGVADLWFFDLASWFADSARQDRGQLRLNDDPQESPGDDNPVQRGHVLGRPGRGVERLVEHAGEDQAAVRGQHPADVTRDHHRPQAVEHEAEQSAGQEHRPHLVRPGEDDLGGGPRGRPAGDERQHPGEFEGEHPGGHGHEHADDHDLPPGRPAGGQSDQPGREGDPEHDPEPVPPPAARPEQDADRDDEPRPAGRNAVRRGEYVGVDETHGRFLGENGRGARPRTYR